MVKQFLGYAIPSAVAMCIASLNTIIDGIFLGNGIGEEALGAVNIVMPITIIFFGIATMMAVGGGALISKYFGSKEDDKAVSIFRQVTYLLIILSLMLSIVSVLFANPIVKIMGATENLQPLAAEYLTFYALFCLPSLLGIAFSSFLRNDNRPKLAMVATICGTICNIILNYIFIFELGLGIKSAAIATGLGQILTLSIALPHFLLKRGKLSFGKQKFVKENIQEIFTIGLPSFFAEAAFSVIIFVHNLILVRVLGEIGISTYAIVNYLTTNIYLVLLGVTLGAQPLISYNYGSKDKDKMITFYKLSNKTSFIIGVGFGIICLVFGKSIISVFTQDQTLIDMAYIAVNINNLAYLVIGQNLTTTMYYQAIEIPKFSNFICAMRSVIVLPIVLVVMSSLFGANGIWISMAISEIIIIFIAGKVYNIENYTEKAIAQNAY
ncbi:MATE family efflux transporter [Romboutsia sp.]|uniref:MATE family efflux transporter n=1 Tax=Romboutsia sp. TaxID=1965302 RepID=UPI003F34F893